MCFTPKVTKASSSPPGAQFHARPLTYPGSPGTVGAQKICICLCQSQTRTSCRLSAATAATNRPDLLKAMASMARDPLRHGSRASSCCLAVSHTHTYGVLPICPEAARVRELSSATAVTSSSCPRKKACLVRGFLPGPRPRAVFASTQRAAQGKSMFPDLVSSTLCRTSALYP